MNKYESTLYLKNPKLLASYGHQNSSKILVEIEDKADQSFCISEIDKQNQLSRKEANFSENREIKNRQKQKSKSKSRISDDLSSMGDSLLIGNANTISLAKNSKSIKHPRSIEDKNYRSDSNLLEKNKNSNEIYVSDLLTVYELADKLSVSSADIIKWLFLKGISVTINELLDVSISTLVAEHYSFSVVKKDHENDFLKNNAPSSEHGKLRAPVITLLGHVDHGKTSLMRAFRQDSFSIQEVGSITQSIGSYEILIDNDAVIHKLIFLDTPGHEAFINMRKRGASITDLVILVVSADDGLKPQTVEAIEYIQSRNLPFIVAINKIDKPEANVDQVKSQLSAFSIHDHNSHIVSVSALNHDNVNSLLSSIIKLAKSQKLKSDPSLPAEGVILDAYLSKQKGSIAQLLVQNGTLHVGDLVLAGNFYGKVKAITDNSNNNIKFIESTALADILCFTDVPSAGLSFKVVSDEKTARTLASSFTNANLLKALNSRISLNDAGQQYAKKITKQVNLIIKTSTQGAIDAIMHALSKLSQEKVQINLLLVASGEVSWKDIELASLTSSTVLTFGLTISSNMLHDAGRLDVSVYSFNIIYDLIDCVKNYMLSFVDLDYEKQILGHAEIKNLFPVNKATVAGCFVKNGKLKKKSYFMIERSEGDVYTGLIDSLKVIKDDVDEVQEGNECGVMCKEYNSWAIGDVLECYELQPLEKTL